jgi:putative spermidine/putrescine transport system substrate-binding protein
MKSVLRAGIGLAAMVSMNGMALAQTLPTSIGAGEGAVNIVAWVGYIERGESDAAYDWVTDFEKQTGCKVAVKTAATSDEMVTLMNTGGFDLVTASGDASLRLVAGKKVVPINTDLIPSWKTLDDRLKDGPWFTVGGQHYGVPYQWGPNVLMYNTNVFKTAPTSWNVVMEKMDLPDGKSNEGRVQAYDGPIYIADAALYLKSKDPSLGIKDPYELNEAQYTAVINLLKGQRTLVGRYWHDATVQVDDFKTEGVVASGSWPYQVNTLVAGGSPIASTIPAEGATGWADTTMLAADAAHPNCAYMWLEHSIQPKVQGDVAAWFGSVPVVPAACKASELLTDTGCATNGFDNFDKIAFWKTPTQQCASQNDQCIPYSRWVSDYIGVMGGQ